jgi:hypothetical protein
MQQSRNGSHYLVRPCLVFIFVRLSTCTILLQIIPYIISCALKHMCMKVHRIISVSSEWLLAFLYLTSHDLISITHESVQWGPLRGVQLLAGRDFCINPTNIIEKQVCYFDWHHYSPFFLIDCSISAHAIQISAVFQVWSYKHKRSVGMGWVLMTKVPPVRSHNSTTSVNLSWSFGWKSQSHHSGGQTNGWLRIGPLDFLWVSFLPSSHFKHTAGTSIYPLMNFVLIPEVII